MPGDLLSGTPIEIARDLRENRVTARELIEAAIAAHERFAERLHAYSLWAPELACAAAAGTDVSFAAGVAAGPSRDYRYRSRTCSPRPGTPASPGRAADCPQILGSATVR